MKRTSRKPNPLYTPWRLYFDRDGTEDYGIICDSEGRRIVASHVCGDDEWDEGTFWLPEEEGDATPLLVDQMKLMAAAPKLLGMLKLAVAVADPGKHNWVKEARALIREVSGKKRPVRKPIAVVIDERDLPF